MKKKWWILIIIAIVLILVFPIKLVYRDGGTVEYSAILYKVIKWNRIRPYEENKTGTEVYFFPQNLHSLEYYDLPRPDAIAIHYSDKFVVANIGTYQWSKKVDGITSHVNACGIGPLEMEYKETLKIVEGTNVKTTITNNVTEIKVYRYNGDEAELIVSNLEYDEENAELNVEKLEKGTYIIELLVEDGNNKVRYSFKLEIVDEK